MGWRGELEQLGERLVAQMGRLGPGQEQLGERLVAQLGRLEPVLEQLGERLGRRLAGHKH